MSTLRKRVVKKEITKGKFRIGDLVLATVQGFPPWPAKISRPEDWNFAPEPKKYFVVFFGTQEVAFVMPYDIKVFTSKVKSKLEAKCKSKTVEFFAQAVEEISAAFEELQNHKSDVLDNEALGNAVEPTLTKPKTLDGKNHKETSKDGNSDKFDSRTDKKCKDEVHRAKRVPDGRAAIDNNHIGPNQKLKDSKRESFDNKVVSDVNIASSKKKKELLKEKHSARICGDKHKHASGADENKDSLKRPRSENGKDKKQCKSKRLLPVGRVSAEGEELQSDKEGVTYTKHPKPTLQHKAPHTDNVKGQSAQLPRRRRVYIDDEDDDEDPKTPLHEIHTNVLKATSASTDGLESVDVSHDTSINAKLLVGFAETTETENIPVCKNSKDASLAQSDRIESVSDSSPMGKPVIELLPENVKPILRSLKKSSQAVSFKKQGTRKNKTTKVSDAGMPDSGKGLSNSSSIGKAVAGQSKIAKVSGVKMPKKCRRGSSKDAVSGSDKVSSQSQTENQISKPASEEKPTDTPKVATPKDSSMNLSPGMIVDQENVSAPLISSRMTNSSSSMKELIAAAKAKTKQAHSHTSQYVNLNQKSISVGEPKTRSPSPLMVHNVLSSADDDKLIVDEGHQEDLILSNHSHQSMSRNQAEEWRAILGQMSVGDADTEATISRDAFEGMIDTLSKAKESIRRATRQAIECANYGIASEIVELLIRKLESEPHSDRKLILFFLVDSITQNSYNKKGIAGALYIPTVQAAMPRILRAAIPPGVDARKNRHHCCKVLRLWRERKIFPDSLLCRYIGDIGASNGNGDSTVGFTLRRPSTSHRSIDDPIRKMEGMLVDEYGSNVNFQQPGVLYSHIFRDEELPSTSQEVKNTYIEEPVHSLGKLEQPPFLESSHPQPNELPPSPPPLPLSPPPLSPPQPLSPPPPLSPSPQPTLLPTSSIIQPYIPSHPSLALQPEFAPPTYPLSQHEYQISMQWSSNTTSIQAANGRHDDGNMYYNHEASLQNKHQQLWLSNTSFIQSPMIKNLAPVPSSQIAQSQPQCSSIPHPYHFPSQSVVGQRYMNEDPRRMRHSTYTQNGTSISGRNSLPDSLTVTDGFLHPPPERSPSKTMSYHQLPANNLQSDSTISGHTASYMLPSTTRWRPS